MVGTVYSILSACYGKKVTKDNIVSQYIIQKNKEAHQLMGIRRQSCCTRKHRSYGKRSKR